MRGLLLHFAASKESLERICNRNGDSYVFPHRRLKHRIAERLIRLYNHALGDASWPGCTADHPAQLRDFWRWCGVWGVMPRTIHFGAHISSCYTKKLVKDEKGVWWCETTFTPRVWLDLRKIIGDNMLCDMEVPEIYLDPKPAAFNPADILLGPYGGKAHLFRRWAESDADREVRQEALRKALALPMTGVLMDLLKHRPRPESVDPAAPGGDCTGRIALHKSRLGTPESAHFKRVFFKRPLGLPFTVTPTDHLPPGIAGLLMYKESPEKNRIVKETTDQ